MKVALLFFSFFYMIPATTIADPVGGVQLPTWVQNDPNYSQAEKLRKKNQEVEGKPKRPLTPAEELRKKNKEIEGGKPKRPSTPSGLTPASGYAPTKQSDAWEIEDNKRGRTFSPSNSSAQAGSTSGTGEANSDSNTCESAAKRATTCCQDAPKCFGGKAASALTTINEFASIFSMASPMISGGKDISKLCKNIQMLSAAASVVTMAAEKKCKKTIKNCESVCDKEKMVCEKKTHSASCTAELEEKKTKCSELEQFATSFKDAGVQLIMTIATTEKCIRDAAGVKVEKCIKAKGQWTEKHGCVTREKCKKELKGQWDTKNNECTGKVMCEEDKNGKWNPTKQECEDEQSCSAKQGDWDPVKKNLSYMARLWFKI